MEVRLLTYLHPSIHTYAFRVWPAHVRYAFIASTCNYRTPIPGLNFAYHLAFIFRFFVLVLRSEREKKKKGRKKGRLEMDSNAKSTGRQEKKTVSG